MNTSTPTEAMVPRVGVPAMIVGSSTIRMLAARVKGCTAGESSVCFVKFASEFAPMRPVIALRHVYVQKLNSRS
jgi:hypothetical protein